MHNPWDQQPNESSKVFQRCHLWAFTSHFSGRTDPIGNQHIPPGCMKSLTACVFWPAWVWTFKPETKWIYPSYSMALSRRDNLRMRRLIESEWYRTRFGEAFRPLDNNWGTAKFVNDRAGFRLCTSVDGTVTGEHADVQVCDDHIKPQDVSKTALTNCLEWWNETMSSRLVDFQKSARVIIMQRLHVNDLAGEMLRSGGYEHPCLPMEFESRFACKTFIGFKDPRIKEGELLWPKRCTPESVTEIKKGIGTERGVAAQLQQQPVPHSSAIFKKDAIKYYAAPPKTPTTITSWDCTFKETGSSYVVGQVWGVSDDHEHYVLVDQIRARMSFSDTLDAIQKLTSFAHHSHRSQELSICRKRHSCRKSCRSLLAHSHLRIAGHQSGTISR